MKPRESLLAFLLDVGTATIPHSGGELLLHLLGTEAILESWGATSDLCLAGLYHAVYGTHSFHSVPLSPTETNRLHVQHQIGSRAEEIVYYYSALNHISIREALEKITPNNIPSTTLILSDTRIRSCVRVRIDTLSSILNLMVANEAEQYARTSYPILDFIFTLSEKHFPFLLPDARSFVLLKRRGYVCP